MPSLQRNANLIFLLAASVVLGCIGATPRWALAQNPLAGWADQNFTTEKSQPIRYSSRETLKDGKFPNDEERQKFIEYYEKQWFPKVTNPAKPQSPVDDVILRLRNDLKIAEKAEQQEVFNTLADMILAYMSKVAADPRYHPTARENAVLAIAEVNSPKAAKVLLDMATSRTLVLPIRVSAMSGLIRLAGPSARGAIAGGEMEPLVVDKMVVYAGFHVPKSDRADGAYWMRGQAADVLAELPTAGANAKVPPALLAMLSDKELPIPLRCKAAKALGKLKYADTPPAAGPNLKALAELVHDAMSLGQPVHRGRVREVARAVSDGLKPFASSAPSSDQPLIQSLQTVVQDLNKATEGDTSDLKSIMQKAKEDLDGVLQNKE